MSFHLRKIGWDVLVPIVGVGLADDHGGISDTPCFRNRSAAEVESRTSRRRGGPPQGRADTVITRAIGT